MNHVTRGGTFAIGVCLGVGIMSIIVAWLGCACP